MKKRYVAMIGFAVLVAYSGVARSIHDANMTPEQKAAIAQEQEAKKAALRYQSDLLVMESRCERAIKSNLRDPDSAVFEETRVKKDGGDHLIYILTRAKNGFGGYTQGIFECTIPEGDVAVTAIRQVE